MVKRQKEKQYQSAREHRTNSQLRAGGGGLGSSHQERRLPFHCCALSLTPYENPVCITTDATDGSNPANPANQYGIVFENTALLPFLLQNKVDPVSGKPMTSRNVMTLHMDKDDEGRWQCPIMTKPLSDHNKIVAIRQRRNCNSTSTISSEANVYSWEAYHELNVKAKNMEDLISGKKFTKKDVIILNDPDSEEFNKMRDINNFHHILNARSLETTKPSSNVQRSVTATRVMEKLTMRAATATASVTSAEASKGPVITSEMVSGKRFTSGATSGSLTSSTLAISNSNESREATQEEILQARFALMRKRKKKGYVTLRTNMGDIGLELHCDMAPRTCTNFLGLAEAGRYDGTKFHRLIPTFMIQGGKGDPDDSLWGDPFVDEFDDRLKHDSEGIVSMANAGPKTNKRQFFVTFTATPHLDRKHSIFGKIIQGMEVLREMKKVPTDKKDRPVHEIIIDGIDVLVNPAKEAEDMENERFEKALSERMSADKSHKACALGKKQQSKPTASAAEPKSSAPAVGKYLTKNLQSLAASSKRSIAEDDGLKTKASRLPAPPKKTKFGDFSGW